MTRQTIYNGYRHLGAKEQKRNEAEERQERPMVVLGCGCRTSLAPALHAERAHPGRAS